MKRGVIGQSLPRVEGVDKVTGSCIYAADIVRPGALWGAFLRSPYPHARILNIDASRARRLRGVAAVITAGDVSSRLEGKDLQDKPLLARDRARYVGEKVAGVAAVDREVAEEALDLIEVEYEELPAVFDPLEAMGPEAPIIHPDYAAYRGPNKEPSLKNVRSRERAGKGEIDRGFSESDEIFENTFRTHMAHQAFLEPRACIVEIDTRHRVAVWHTNQGPFMVRKYLSVHLDIPEEMIVVQTLATGGSFGAKSTYEDALCTYYLARASGRPVKVVESYADELVDGQPRHASVAVLRTGVKKDGRLWAWDGRIVYNGGAYAAHTPRNGLNGTFLLAGCYRTPHVRIEGCIVYTNQVPSGYFRGPGEVQAVFAAESQMDMIAEALGLDPLELRRRNALGEGDTKPTGQPIRDPRAHDVLRRVGEIASPRRPGGKSPRDRPTVIRGRGMSLGYRHIGGGESSAELFLEPDGSLRLSTSVNDVGVGAHTMHRQVAAETLGIDPALIRIDVGGTDTGAYDEGVRAQRGTHVEGQAVHRAANALIEALVGEAAAFWEVEAAQVRWEKGRAWLSRPKKQVLDLRGLARLCAGRGMRGFGHYKGATSDVYAFQAIVADVELDSETGQIRVQRLCLVHDATRVINPIIYSGQLEGSVTQGVGFTLMEHFVVEEGRVLTLNLGDYKIPTIQDISPLTISLVKAEEGPGPFGAKAVAESGIGVVAPAIANAIYNASGVRVRDLPVTPEKILEGLREAKGHTV